MRCLSWESPGTALLVLVLTGKRAHSVRGKRARNPSHTQGSELERQDLRRFRPTAQQTWRRDWPERRSRDCEVTCSNENSLKKLIHYGDWECIPLAPLRVAAARGSSAWQEKKNERWLSIVDGGGSRLKYCCGLLTLAWPIDAMIADRIQSQCYLLTRDRHC